MLPKARVAGQEHEAVVIGDHDALAGARPGDFQRVEIDARHRNAYDLRRVRGDSDKIADLIGLRIEVDEGGLARCNGGGEIRTRRGRRADQRRRRLQSSAATTTLALLTT